jgi:hypothetical protein
MGCQNPPNDVLVDLDAEGFSQATRPPGSEDENQPFAMHSIATVN